MGYHELQQRLDTGERVYLDGGIGTEILRRGYSWAGHQLTSEPELNLDIHKDYIKAGADIITTNTFQLSKRSFRNHFASDRHLQAVGVPGLLDRASELIREAVGLAREARQQAGRPDVLIAASITTLEWCFRPDRTPDLAQVYDEYLEELEDYKRAGADLFLFETFNATPEAQVAIRAARELGMPAWVAFVPYRDGALLGGENMVQVVDAMTLAGPDVLLLNCAPPAHITAGLEKLAPLWEGPLGAYAHVGRFNPPEWQFTDDYPPDKYLAACRHWHELGATVIGGCCGTTPDHITTLTRSL